MWDILGVEAEHHVTKGPVISKNIAKPLNPDSLERSPICRISLYLQKKMQYLWI
jgi:hypothetical protein